MTGANSVDVKTFHNLDILYHTLTCNEITTIWIHFVSVGTLEENGLSVDKYL